MLLYLYPILDVFTYNYQSRPLNFPIQIISSPDFLISENDPTGHPAAQTTNIGVILDSSFSLLLGMQFIIRSSVNLLKHILSLTTFHHFHCHLHTLGCHQLSVLLYNSKQLVFLSPSYSSTECCPQSSQSNFFNYKSDHLAPLLISLQWFPSALGTKFKVLIAYKSLVIQLLATSPHPTLLPLDHSSPATQICALAPFSSWFKALTLSFPN